MKKMNLLSLTAAVACGALLSACGGAPSIGDIGGAYNGAKGAYTGWHSLSMVKDLAHTKPYFQGYDNVVVMAQITPRDTAPALPAAFTDNMGYIVGNVVRIMRSPQHVCAQLQGCPGRTLLVQFREDSYNSNIVEKMTMGAKVRGSLIYSDGNTGQVLGESKVEAADNYFALADLVASTVYLAALRSYPPKNSSESDRISGEMNALPKVKPEYKSMFASAT